VLAQSDTNVAASLKRFGEKNIDVALLVPTRTGLEKSIMDATMPLRDLLARAGIHDYQSQGQGEDHKVSLPTRYLRPTEVKELKASLYRPTTKSGDPRIWFAGLAKLAQPNNLLAIFVDRGQLMVVNCSELGALDALDQPGTALGAIAAERSTSLELVAAELLEKLRIVSARGFVPTIREGDTGVGTTLEHLLGIAANARRTPDYRGIEIKASRQRPRQTRVTLFSQVPDWDRSPIGSAWNLLQAIGYVEGGRLQYYHSLSAKKANSHGLVLEVKDDWLHQQREIAGSREAMTCWAFDTLRARLLEKHAQTFWVKAKYKRVSGAEHYHYVEVVHTRAPFAHALDMLVDAGSITLDYTLSEKRPGIVRDHGYLFKIKPGDMGALFPPPLLHQLC